MRSSVVVIGAGFTGLCAAWELTRAGLAVTVLEASSTPGGLAGSFEAGGVALEKFYHHWFTSDTAIDELAGDLGVSEHVRSHEGRTGMYFANALYRLTTPLDLLRFAPLSPVDRLRLGWLAIHARALRDWRVLEGMTAQQWLLETCGRRVYDVVWAPLLRAKFGAWADRVCAVWMWNKLVLRGGSRDRRGHERLRYFEGGFAALVDALVAAIERQGGRVICGEPATRADAFGASSANARYDADATLITTALPVAAALLRESTSEEYRRRLERINYLGNVCLVLELDRSLGDLYWINISDPSFPFTAVIEHTNFQPVDRYGAHIVYVSRYLAVTDPAYAMDDVTYCDEAFAHLQRMFPQLERAFVRAYHVWREPYAQPLIECGYSQMLPDEQTPVPNVYLASMAQIYPEDRGTNYAVRAGRAVAQRIALQLTREPIRA